MSQISAAAYTLNSPYIPVGIYALEKEDEASAENKIGVFPGIFSPELSSALLQLSSSNNVIVNTIVVLCNFT